MIFWYFFKGKKRNPYLTYSNTEIFKDLKPTVKERLKDVPFLLRILGIALLIIAASRPQTFSSGENIYTEGIDVAMLLDISGSMLAEDFKPNRLEAAKNVIDEFITLNPESVTPDDPLAYALNKMHIGGFRNVPVVNDELYPIGIISITDIIATIADYFHSEIINLPPLDKLVDTTAQEGG